MCHDYLRVERGQILYFQDFWSPLAALQPLLPLEELLPGIAEVIGNSLLQKKLSLESIPIPLNLQTHHECMVFLMRLAGHFKDPLDRNVMEDMLAKRTIMPFGMRLLIKRGS